MIKSLVEHFAALDDPRCAKEVEHRLVDVLVIAVCAVVAEVETFEDIALYDRCSTRRPKHSGSRRSTRCCEGIEDVIISACFRQVSIRSNFRGRCYIHKDLPPLARDNAELGQIPEIQH